ncbi:ABC transporter ATP-binding protein [Falsirhodobacter xinxiangensis]|uniref:ABC transporter ATP-binding protein n=1 Tax=Falsirhodobacter xinxiangensis TaxID=2530049 RepID=UPI0010AAD9F9|nr:ABC transporter ATP-binding protein [Rhodobacter xinxiangensis]
MLTLTDIRKSYDTSEGSVTVLDGVSLSLPPGGTVALTGESGSGKSTLLHLAAGLDAPDGGSVEVAGQPMGRTDAERARMRRETVGLVFQQFNLIPSLDVAANMAFQARLAGRFDPAWQAELAGALGLSALLHRYPEQLSGGQQQRVAIGRALAGRPALILADEPTGNLDEATGDQVMALMLRLVADTGAALLMVTHSPRLAAMLDRHAHLRAGRLA